MATLITDNDRRRIKTGRMTTMEARKYWVLMIDGEICESCHATKATDPTIRIHHRLGGRLIESLCSTCHNRKLLVRFQNAGARIANMFKQIKQWRLRKSDG